MSDKVELARRIQEQERRRRDEEEAKWHRSEQLAYARQAWSLFDEAVGQFFKEQTPGPPDFFWRPPNVPGHLPRIAVTLDELGARIRDANLLPDSTVEDGRDLLGGEYLDMRKRPSGEDTLDYAWQLLRDLWAGLQQKPSSGDLEPVLADTALHLVLSWLRILTRAIVHGTLVSRSARAMPAENRATSEVNAEQGDAKPGTERPALTNTPSQPHFETWALGCAYGDVWQLFKKAGDRWHHRGPFKGLCSGRQAELLKKFADGGGFLSDDAARKLFRETYGESDKVRILKIVKPVLSALRRVIRVAVAGTKNTPDPLPRDKHMHGLQARIQIGYAFYEEGKWLFKTKQQLSPEELLDSCPRVRVQPRPTS